MQFGDAFVDHHFALFQGHSLCYWVGGCVGGCTDVGEQLGVFTASSLRVVCVLFCVCGKQVSATTIRAKNRQLLAFAC